METFFKLLAIAGILYIVVVIFTKVTKSRDFSSDFDTDHTSDIIDDIVSSVPDDVKARAQRFKALFPSKVDLYISKHSHKIDYASSLSRDALWYIIFDMLENEIFEDISWEADLDDFKKNG